MTCRLSLAEGPEGARTPEPTGLGHLGHRKHPNLTATPSGAPGHTAPLGQARREGSIKGRDTAQKGKLRHPTLTLPKEETWSRRLYQPSYFFI